MSRRRRSQTQLALTAFASSGQPYRPTKRTPHDVSARRQDWALGLSHAEKPRTPTRRIDDSDLEPTSWAANPRQKAWPIGKTCDIASE